MLKRIEHEKTTFFDDLKIVFRALPQNRKKQLYFLFFLQNLSAISEVLSLGAIIPFLSAISNIDNLMSNRLVKKILEILTIEDPNHVVILFAIIFAASILLANFLRFITLWAQLYLNAKISIEMGAKVFNQIISNKFEFFVYNNSSTILRLITHDLNGTIAVLYGALSLTTNGLIVVFISLSLIIYTPLISISIFLIMFAIYGSLMFVVGKKLKSNSKVLSDAHSSILQAAQESVFGVREVIIKNLGKYFTCKYKNNTARYHKANISTNLIKQTPKFFIESLGISALCLVIIGLVSGGGDIKSLIPLIGAIALAAHRLLPSLQQTYVSFSTAMGLSVSLNRIATSLKQIELRTLTTSKSVTIPFNAHITLKNVEFKHGKDNKKHNFALENISLKINAKSKVAFVGETGSGKTTLSEIILGLYIPQKGKVMVDDTIISEQNIQEWQKSISIVPQNIRLSDTSIIENIAFGINRAEIDTEKVREAAKQAHIHDFILSLPNGYEEVTGEQGIKLSGGQAQRIGIARALYSSPKLIIFDEATSALDNNTEKEVINSINSLGNQYTMIFIAHRLSTIQKADEIFVFDKGKITDRGTYSDLVKSSKTFSRLVSRIKTN